MKQSIVTPDGRDGRSMCCLGVDSQITTFRIIFHNKTILSSEIKEQLQKKWKVLSIDRDGDAFIIAIHCMSTIGENVIAQLQKRFGVSVWGNKIANRLVVK